MKKIILGTLALFLVAQVYALNITDPFYMPKKGGFISDTTALKVNSGSARAWGLREVVSYGIMDELTIGAGLGWAKVKHGDNGLEDPTFYGRYRIADETKTSNGIIVDLKAYISPEVFDSPLNGEKGVAKGSTDYGVSVMVGSKELAKDFVLWAEAGVDLIGSTKFTKSSNVIFLSANAKYYMDDLNSFDGGLFVKKYSAGDGYTGTGIRFDYVRLLQDNLALIPFWSAESHSDNVPSTVQFGVSLRYTF